MTPGPTEVEQRVLDSLAKPPMLHYGEEWKRFYSSTLELMRKLFDADSDDMIILVPAAGSACLEMAIINLAHSGEKILNLRNGYFGEITKECGKRHDMQVLEFETEYGKPISASKVKEMLQGDENIRAIMLVHNETSTGVLNSVEEIGHLAKHFGVPLIVDTVSSFGALRVKMKEWNCSICVGYASKGLSAISGVVPMAIKREVWDDVCKRDQRIGSGRFFSFQVWDRYIREWGSWGHPFPTTMPTSVIRALNVAANIALDEGLDQRASRHQRVAAQLRKDIRGIGLTILPDEGFASSTVTAVTLTNEAQDKARAVMEKEYGVIISGGLSVLKNKIIRIGHMGVTATSACTDRAVTALDNSLRRIVS